MVSHFKDYLKFLIWFLYLRKNSVFPPPSQYYLLQSFLDANVPCVQFQNLTPHLTCEIVVVEMSGLHIGLHISFKLC